jgi:hypothetical protein
MSFKPRGKLLIPGIFLLFFSLAFRVLLPSVLGFYLILGVAGLALTAASLWGLIGPFKKAWDPKGLLKRWGMFTGAVVLVLLAGYLSFLPVINVAAPEEAALDAGTLELIAKLPGKVSFNANLALSSPGPILFLLDLYKEASPLIELHTQNAKGHTEITPDGDLRVAEQDTLSIISEGFKETIFPINKNTINASLRRLISPHRLVYNLIGEGERSSLDPGPGGLRIWAEELKERRIYLDDHPFPEGGALPLDVRAIVIAGPRAPLSEEKEAALLDYLEKGGKILIFLDPLVAGVSNDFLSRLSLRFPDGLIVDPERVWAGTEDTFVVSSDFPAHPMTLGLRDPVVWPLAGAIMTLGEKDSALPKPAQRELVLKEGDPLSSGQGAPEKEETAISEGPEGLPRPRAVLKGRTNAVALTSSSAWLETDKKSIAAKSIRFQKDSDPPGPLVLASATTLVGGGKLVLLADSDLASNAYINFAGNMELLNQAMYFLLDSDANLASPRKGVTLEVTESVAREFFWIPVVLWPLLVLLIWTLFYFHRRRLSS